MRYAAQRLFVYGSLAPGRPNAHVLADIGGTWQRARVRGHLHADGWGAAIGFPGLVPSPDGERVEGLLFSAADLPAHWTRLDKFEGERYARTTLPVELDDGTSVEAQVYMLATAPP